MEYWNIFSTIVQLLSTVVLAIATVMLALFTLKYVKATSQMVEEMRATRDPLVSLDLDISVGMILLIRNLGQTAAKNFKISFKHKVPWVSERIERLNVFQNGISHISPGRTFKFLSIGSIDWKKLKEEGGYISFEFEYENERGKKIKQETFFDLLQYSSVLFESFRDPTLEVAEAIKSFERSYHSLKTSSERTNIIGRAMSLKSCPVCAELISKEAKKCPHCLERIQGRKYLRKRIRL